MIFDDHTFLNMSLLGLYGILWVVKSFLFGDRRWEKRVPLWHLVIIALALASYWIAPFSICSRGYEAPPWVLGLAVFSFGLGVFFHFVSDL